MKSLRLLIVDDEEAARYGIRRALESFGYDIAEAETRRLIDYLGLPFEEGCLRFYETKRTVLTPSAEQVRKPISKDAVEHWRNFEPWLGPLIGSLGSVLTEYPSVPAELR